MITVKVFRDGKAILGLDISGHSDYRPRGSDIVCAAVSALGQTAVLALKEVAGIDADFICRDGHLQCLLPHELDPGSFATAQLIFRTILSGIGNIARHYARHVKLTDEEV